MPAPLAKGIIITLSLLCAAGIAIYENPSVQAWIEDSRRKVEMAFRDIGHELNGRPREDATRCPGDASTQEDDTPEAIERRRLARQEILERGRKLEERRRSRQAASESKSRSFDEIVDKDGTLKPEAATTATETAEQSNSSGLRYRTLEAKAAALGAATANPFNDEMYITHDQDSEEQDQGERGARTPTHAPTPLTSPPLPPKPAAYLPQALRLNTSNHSNPTNRTFSDKADDDVLNLTPTTSVAVSPFADEFPTLTPQSTHPNGQPAASSSPQHSYWSVNEWAQQHSVVEPEAFYSPPQTEAGNRGLATGDLERAMSEMMSSENGSMMGDGERVSQMGSVDERGWDSDMDDDGPGISTPGSWTDVGSTVSEDL